MACPVCEKFGADAVTVTSAVFEKAWTDSVTTCRCGHLALAHDSGGGCSLCPCRGFRASVMGALR